MWADEMAKLSDSNPETLAIYRPERRAIRWIGSQFLLASKRLIRPLGTLRAQKIGFVLGDVCYFLSRRYRNAAMRNLVLAYGEQKSDRDYRRITRSVFRNFGATVFEFLTIPDLSEEEIRKLVDVYGEESLKECEQMGKGVLLITGHIGNWELLARWQVLSGRKLHVVARRTRDPRTTNLMTQVRESAGYNVLHVGETLRPVLQALKRKEYVAILPDQNANDVFVPFFGRLTGTVSGPARICLKTGAPIVIVWCVRMPNGRFRIEHERPVCFEPTGDTAEDIRRIMGYINSRLEHVIRQYPTQWLWLHNRWKSSPNNSPLISPVSETNIDA